MHGARSSVNLAHSHMFGRGKTYIQHRIQSKLPHLPVFEICEHIRDGKHRGLSIRTVTFNVSENDRGLFVFQRGWWPEEITLGRCVLMSTWRV